MKQYTVDELRPQDYEKIKDYLNENLSGGGIDGVYWIPIDSDLLSREQAAHTDCHPLYFMADLEPDQLSCELLVRTQNKIRCTCMGYATETQRNWVIRYIDGIFDTLNIAA